MKRHWEVEELTENFMLRPEEHALLSGRFTSSQLGMAVFMKFFQHEGRFPNKPSEVPEAVVAFLARQLGLTSDDFKSFSWSTNTIKRLRQEIRRLYEFRPASRSDQRKVKMWLWENVVAHEQNNEKLKELVYERFRAIHREPPTPEQIQEIIHSAVSTYERHFYITLYNRLPQEARDKLKALLASPQPSEEDDLEKIPLSPAQGRPR